MKIILDLVPKCGLFERSFNKLIQNLFIFYTSTFMGKGNVAINRLGKWIGPLEDHADVLTHLVNVDIRTIDVYSLVKNLPCYLGNINRIIHTVETAEIG